MTKKIFKTLVVVLLLFAVFFPYNTNAQIFGTGEVCELGPGGSDPCDEGYTCSGSIEEEGVCQLTEPEKVGIGAIKSSLGESGVAEKEDIGDLIISYVNFSLPYLALAAFVGFVYAGFLYVTAYGSEEQLGKSKKILIYSIVGLMLVILSFSIVQFFTESLVKGITGE